MQCASNVFLKKVPLRKGCISMSEGNYFYKKNIIHINSKTIPRERLFLYFRLVRYD